MLLEDENLRTVSQFPIARILIVEDQEETALALSEYLKLESFSPIIARDVFSALELIKKQIPDIIISDICMPGKSGIDLFAELKNHPAWSEIPFIILSGKEDESSIHESIKLGCDHYLKKPVNPGELKALILGKLKQTESRKKLEYTKLENFKKRIVHTLSHEFRTPLVSITTGTELLLEERKNLEEEQVQNLLKSILRGGLRLERLVEDFMTIQQIEVGQASDVYQEFATPVTISEFLKKLKEKESFLFSDTYPARTFEIEAQSSCLKIKIDTFMPQLIDSFIRIIDNAYKFSGKQPKCIISVIENEDQNILFSIRDWGSGLPENISSDQEVIEKFTQINRDLNEQQGCGIGLSIASYFIDLHRGKLKVIRPQEKQGLEVQISIPCIK